MFKTVPLEKYYRLINHGPCVLISSGNETDTNLAPIAWNMPLNDEPPMVAVAVAETHYTAELINKTGEFVINVVTDELLPAIKHCGGVSGRNENKIKKMGLITLPGNNVKVSHLEKGAAFLECKVTEKHYYDGVVLFIGKVLYSAAQDDLFDEYWITEKAKVVHHLGGNYFACLDKRFKA